jgi:hypothetical protein
MTTPTTIIQTLNKIHTPQKYYIARIDPLLLKFLIPMLLLHNLKVHEPIPQPNIPDIPENIVTVGLVLEDVDTAAFGMDVADDGWQVADVVGFWEAVGVEDDEAADLHEGTQL